LDKNDSIKRYRNNKYEVNVLMFNNCLVIKAISYSINTDSDISIFLEETYVGLSSDFVEMLNRWGSEAFKNQCLNFSSDWVEMLSRRGSEVFENQCLNFSIWGGLGSIARARRVIGTVSTVGTIGAIVVFVRVSVFSVEKLPFKLVLSLSLNLNSVMGLFMIMMVLTWVTAGIGTIGAVVIVCVVTMMGMISRVRRVVVMVIVMSLATANIFIVLFFNVVSKLYNVFTEIPFSLVININFTSFLVMFIGTVCCVVSSMVVVVMVVSVVGIICGIRIVMVMMTFAFMMALMSFFELFNILT
jgi:hypothetical protein